MKALALILFICTIAHAATPTMWVKDRSGRIPLRIDTIDVEINITGDLAETTLTLRFRNETNRIQEGEFVMPLPAGSTVSSYALEVNGQLRDGVAVEKKQARNAYETIKRQKIDPGLVEREANNTYRTKVFPIPAKGTKLIRISYIEQLGLHQGNLRYTLPTNYPGKINEFTCTIRQQHGKYLNIQSKDLSFEDDDDSNTLWKASVKDHQFTGDLTITMEPLNGHLLTEPIPDTADASYFYLSYNPPEEAIEKPRRTPKHINIIWDASDSNRSQNHDQELKLLDSYFQQLNPTQTTKVSLQILRNTLKNAGEYSITKGDWKQLRTALENIFYDGSTNVGCLEHLQHQADLTFLFTDATREEDSDALRLDTRQTTFIFHHGSIKSLAKHTSPTFGASINLSQSNIEKNLHRLTHTRFRVERVVTENTSIFPASSNRTDKQCLVGIFQETPTEPIKILYRNGNGETINQRISTTVIKKAPAGETLKRFWAQEKLTQLEKQGNDQTKVIAHCQTFGLVSDYTSLIVLERFIDYVRFNIPPPEPDLRRKWAAERRKKKTFTRSSDSLETRIRQSWQRKLHWYQRTFTCRSKTLVDQTNQIQIWLRAIHSAFNNNDLDPQAYGVIESWYQESLNLAKTEQKIIGQKSYLQWATKEKKLIKQWAKFPSIPIKKSKQEKLAVSIRGLVIKPDTYRTDHPLTLKDAITLAGGLHSVGSLQSISLYRNAHALTYNLLSKNYKDIPLLPGDMVVAGVDPYYYEHSDDPFGGGTPTRPDPSSNPAVSALTPRVSGSDNDVVHANRSGAFGGSQPPKVNLTANVRILPPVGKNIDQEALRQFEHALSKKSDPLTIYKNLKGNRSHPIPFYIQVARLLQKNNHPALALQVISNIREDKPHNTFTQREYAYALGAIGRYDMALEIFRSIKRSHPDDFQNQLDIARYLQQSNPKHTPDYQKLITLTKQQHPKTNAHLVSIALTERNATQRKMRATTVSNFQNLASDIRCVVYSSHPQMRIQFSIKEPNGATTTPWHSSIHGGRLFSAPGIQEYMLKRAMPGTYKLTYTSYYPVTIQVAFYTHWGTKKQTCQWSTVHLNADTGNSPIAECTFSLDD